MEPEDTQRVAMNEAVFRKVNEGMEAGQEPSGLLSFVCECGRLRCNQLIQLTRAEYESVRSDPRRFAIVDGHEILEAESIVERWASRELLDAHLESDHVAKALERAEELFGDSADIVVYEPLEGGEAKKGSLAKHAGVRRSDTRPTGGRCATM